MTMCFQRASDFIELQAIRIVAKVEGPLIGFQLRADLGGRKPGDLVNVEPDILGKYVAKFVKGMQNS